MTKKTNKYLEFGVEFTDACFYAKVHLTEGWDIKDDGGNYPAIGILDSETVIVAK